MSDNKQKGQPHHLVSESHMDAQLKKEGFTEQFVMTDEGMKDSDGKYVQSGDMTLVKEFRFEGNSNPDDMSITYAVETKDGKKGIITNAYGTYSDSRIDEFMKDVDKKEGATDGKY